MRMAKSWKAMRQLRRVRMSEFRKSLLRAVRGESVRGTLWSTPWGERFHVNGGCPTLSQTRVVKYSQWCSECTTSAEMPQVVFHGWSRKDRTPECGSAGD